ncbi:MAG: carbohydrate ABC transporter permease [Acidimicrobiales bacterium]|jgi:multiple sugar transport system permease protein
MTTATQPKTKRSWARRITSNVGLAIAVFLLLLPILWGIGTALKPEADAFDNSLSSFLHAKEFSNFVTAWNYGPFGRFLINGLIVGVLGAALTVSTSLLAGYGFARLHFRGREKLFFLYIATLVVPQQVLVVPMFFLMKDLGWINSYQGLIVPWAFSAFGVFLMRQFFRSIPIELEEAAKVDGASHFYIFSRIMVPMVVPAVGVLGLFTFIAYWNSFLWPLILIDNRNLATVPLGLEFFLSEQGYQWNLLMAGGTISLVPGLILAFVLQRWLSRGISLSGIGGR